ncbi:MAG: hypothetical protein RLY97_1589 [Pseudomonadota bacterium]|jgi:hypothetical protein
MKNNLIYRMDSELWRESLADVCRFCPDADDAEQGDALRETYALMSIAPRGQLAGMGHLPDRMIFENMLMAGAYESAALALVPPSAGFLLSRGSNGVHLASVILAGSHDEVAAEANSPAMALVAALAGGLRFVGDDNTTHGSLAANEMDALAMRPATWLN